MLFMIVYFSKQKSQGSDNVYSKIIQSTIWDFLYTSEKLGPKRY